MMKRRNDKTHGSHAERFADTGVSEITPFAKKSHGRNPFNPHINRKLRPRQVALMAVPPPNRCQHGEKRAFLFGGGQMFLPSTKRNHFFPNFVDERFKNGFSNSFSHDGPFTVQTDFS